MHPICRLPVNPLLPKMQEKYKTKFDTKDVSDGLQEKRRQTTT